MFHEPEMGLVPIFDSVVGVAQASLESCTVLAGESLGTPQCLLPILPFFKQSDIGKLPFPYSPDFRRLWPLFSCYFCWLQTS